MRSISMYLVSIICGLLLCQLAIELSTPLWLAATCYFMMGVVVAIAFNLKPKPEDKT